MIQNTDVTLPNFLIVGAAKAGTTSLYHYVKQHPEVFMSKVKGPHFISAQFKEIPENGINDSLVERYVTDFHDYCRLFEGAAGKKAIGEASSENLYYYKDAVTYIHQFFGDPKIVIILRNPVERAFSAYVNLVRDQREFLSFEDALKQEKQRIQDNWNVIWYYKDSGFYAAQVKAYQEQFRDVQVCLFDDLKDRPLDLMRDLYDFLEVDPAFVPDTSLTYNISGIPTSRLLNRLFVKKYTRWQKIARGVGEWILTEQGWAALRERLRAKILVKPRMKPETKRDLEQMYSEDILRLQTIIGRDLSHWLNDTDSNQETEFY